jgi:hypothetical protein
VSAAAAAVIHVAPGTFLAIVAASALAGTFAGMVAAACWTRTSARRWH